MGDAVSIGDAALMMYEDCACEASATSSNALEIGMFGLQIVQGQVTRDIPLLDCSVDASSSARAERLQVGMARLAKKSHAVN